ncbi:ATP-dependent DNA helicase PIF1-like protein [Tanacetum coccineum]
MIERNAPIAKKFQRENPVFDKVEYDLLLCGLKVIVPGGCGASESMRMGWPVLCSRRYYDIQTSGAERRMNLISSILLNKRLPLKIVRKQFPLSVSFAMTINKSQGQSLSNVGLYLPRPVFTHGQLYVVVSRVTSKKGLKVVVCDKDGNLSKRTTMSSIKRCYMVYERLSKGA